MVVFVMCCACLVVEELVLGPIVDGGAVFV